MLTSLFRPEHDSKINASDTSKPENQHSQVAFSLDWATKHNLYPIFMQPAPASPPDDPENAVTDEGFAELRSQAAEANINEKTLLATDYLNHFNEFVMVLDLIPDMPDCLEDAEAWQPKNYQEHFRDSAFSAKELAIKAYEHSPAEYRDQFEFLVDMINSMIPKGLDRIRSALSEGNIDRVSFECTNTSKTLQKLMDLVSAVINGEKPTIDQQGIDTMLEN